MKKLAIVGLMGVAGFSPAAAAENSTTATGSHPVAGNSVTYVARDMDASIVWTGSKVTGSSHTGTIMPKENALEFRGKDLVGGSFTMDMSSIKVTDLSGGSASKLEGHLKSDDFFGVANFPTSAFRITEVTPGSEKGSYTVTGDLTIKSTTKSVNFPVMLTWEGNMAIAKATIVVDRADYDVRFGSGRFFDGLGDRAIKDDFTLDVELVTTVME